MVPDGWELGQVSDVCRFQNGYGFTPPVWDTHGLPIIRIQNLNGSKNFNYFSGEPNPKWIVKPGQMLFAWAGTKGASFGPTIWQGETGVLNQHIFKVFDADGVDHTWLYLLLRHVTDRIETKAHGFKTTLVHVKKADIENQPIHIPPLPEQKKIAEILSTWDRAIEVAEAQLDCVRIQKRALMQQLLTGKRRFPEFAGQEWKEVRLGELADVERGKFSARPRNDPQFYGGEHPFVQTGDVSRSSLFLASHSQTLNDLGLSVSRMFPSGTILMTIAANIGDVALSKYPVACPDSVVGITAKSGVADPMWLLHMLEMEKEGLDRSAPKLAQKNINLARLRPLPISTPSLSEQIKIGSVLFACEGEIDAMDKFTQKLRTEKKALMQKLLTGKRRVTV
ncbi:restriction endonuclease subunit S [Parasedimentitalea marina]|uniref:Restriction endonuclease subunit S n=1 Tax=Parasedimentitalea marina TaxID=2483033 RepID=A0A3T0MZD5_9RHOB|nr:restriction endonuclease subunit S [Parasedimentitalea marina]AZV77128.1 restriction endonuclease subunit S [Parasedimentitalea marina]